MQMKTCVQCQRSFDPHTMWQKFCRTACRLKAWALLHRPAGQTQTRKEKP